MQREDDKAEVIERRLQKYDAETAPLKAFYEKGLLQSIDGVGLPEGIYEEHQEGAGPPLSLARPLAAAPGRAGGWIYTRRTPGVVGIRGFPREDACHFRTKVLSRRASKSFRWSTKRDF